MANSSSARAKIPEPRTTRDWHLYNVFNDPDFLTAVGRIKQLEKSGETDKAAKLRIVTAEYFRLTKKELGKYLIGQIIYVGTNETSTALRIDTDSGTGTITFDLLATNRDEILEQFASIEDFRKTVWKTKTPRRRAPLVPGLVYAIFRAHEHRGMTFPQIYDAYKSGELDGWDKPPTMFTYPKMLENYYRLYKP